MELSKTATIKSGNSQSNVIDLENYQAVGLLLPAAWTTANITVLVSNTYNPSDNTDTTGFQSLTDDAGAEFTITAAAAKAIGIRRTTSPLLPFRYMVLRSGTNGTPVNQGADRAIQVILRDPRLLR